MPCAPLAAARSTLRSVSRLMPRSPMAATVRPVLAWGLAGIAMNATLARQRTAIAAATRFQPIRSIGVLLASGLALRRLVGQTTVGRGIPDVANFRTSHGH